jgi:phage host-nuclease inhibitor protein Gam
MQSSLYSIGPTIIRASDSYLVSGEGGDQVEVHVAPGGLVCDCFYARVLDDGRCQHIQAIEAQYGDGNPCPSDVELTQARADHYLLSIAGIDQTLEQNQISADQQSARISEWLDHEQSKLERQKGYYTLALEAWMQNNDLSSKRLVNGSVALRKQQPEIEITDEAMVLSDSRFVRVIPEKQAVDKTALRKWVLTTGEEIPGVNVRFRELKFSYKTEPMSKEMNHGTE